MKTKNVEKTVSLEVNQITDYTFRINKNFEINRDAEKIIIECYDESKRLLKRSTIYDSHRSGLKTYNQTLNNNNDATLRNKKKIREGIIKKYNLSVNTQIQATLTIKEDGTHLYKITIPGVICIWVGDFAPISSQ